MMPDALLILLTTIFVNNFVMVQFLGLCPFMGSSQRMETAIGMSTATTFVLTLACGVSYLVNAWLLVPFNLEYLRTIAFIVVIATLVRFSEVMMRATQPVLHQLLGIFVPLITTNCAVLGVALLNVREAHGLAESILYGFGAAIGFSGLLVVFAAIREKQQTTQVPLPFQGAAINMITAGIVSMAFMGFAGMS